MVRANGIDHIVLHVTDVALRIIPRRATSSKGKVRLVIRIDLLPP